MANPDLTTSSGSVSPWYSIFTNTVGFLMGLLVGGVTGYFGNWLWYRFGPDRKKPHFSMTTQDGSTSFSGVMTEENRQDILRSFKAIRTDQPKKSIKTSIPDISDQGTDRS